MDLKTTLIKFAVDFAEGAAAGAIAAFLAAGDVTNPKAILFIVVLGAFDGGISALRRYIQAAAKP